MILLVELGLLVLVIDASIANGIYGSRVGCIGFVETERMEQYTGLDSLVCEVG